MSIQTTVRLNEDNYKGAREILEYMGMSYAQAINVFNKMIVLNKGLPFEIAIPNKQTIAAMNEAINMEGEYVDTKNLELSFPK